MAKVMLREENGEICFYIAKKDMEETITKIEFESDENWNMKGPEISEISIGN